MSEIKENASQVEPAGVFSCGGLPPPRPAELASPPPPRFRLIAIAAIALLASLFSAYSLYERHLAITAGEEASKQIADLTALAADGTFDTARQLLESMTILARTDAPGKPDAAALRAHLLRLKARNPYVMDLLMISPGGTIQHWTGRGMPPDIRDREYYSAHASQAVSSLYIGPPLLSKVHDGLWFFAMSEALRDPQGNIEQVLAVIIDVSLLRNRLSVRMAIPDSSQALLSADNTVYARTPEHANYVGKKIARPDEFAPLSNRNPTATYYLTSQLDGKERIITFRRLANYPMVAVGTVPLESLLQPWKHRLLVIVLLWLGLSAAILWITQRASAIHQLQTELATIDSLTGIYNRRSIMETALQLERTEEHAGTLSILMIDVDHFKAINDDFGHAIGDEVLQRISRSLRTQIRATDFVGRYGGEEFLVLMPDTGPDGALIVAEKLRSAVAEAITRPRKTTISIGIATTSETDATLDRTLSRADAALYKAKQAGRNCIKVAQ